MPLPIITVSLGAVPIWFPYLSWTFRQPYWFRWTPPPLPIVLLLYSWCSFRYLNTICSPALKGNTNGLTPLCKSFRKDSFRMGWHLKGCYPNTSALWTEKVSQEFPANRSINNQTLAGVLCAPLGFIFVCSALHFLWTYECLGSWWTGGQCFLARLTVPFIIHSKSEASHWSTH